MPAQAQEQEAEKPAAGADIFFSSDSEETEIVRAGIDFDLRNYGDDQRAGVRFEKAWYDPLGTGTVTSERVFVQAADNLGPWNWSARVGTDGDTVIGSASAYVGSRWRKEVFVERDIVETPLGLTEGIYSTFAGAALDVPLNDRNVVTALVGIQEFTGKNERLHLRGTYAHVVNPDWGLSAQFRGRYFHSSMPGEFDYYSPRWYAQVLPVMQVRRFIDGWELLGAGGIGIQRDANTEWRQSNFAHVRLRSPAEAKHWRVHGELTYTNAPADSAATGASYSYFQTMLGVSRRF